MKQIPSARHINMLPALRLTETRKEIPLHEHYDASLALGEVFIALGNQASAVDACTQALVFKPADANACIETAKGLQTPVDESAAPAASSSR